MKKLTSILVVMLAMASQAHAFYAPRSEICTLPLVNGEMRVQRGLGENEGSIRVGDDSILRVIYVDQTQTSVSDDQEDIQLAVISESSKAVHQYADSCMEGQHAIFHRTARINKLSAAALKKYPDLREGQTIETSCESENLRQAARVRSCDN